MKKNLSRLAQVKRRHALQWDALMRRQQDELDAMLKRFTRQQHDALKRRGAEKEHQPK